MSEIMLTVCDSERAIHNELHGSFGERVIAALSADPETIDELAAAVRRFAKVDEQQGFFAGWSAGRCDRPWDAGVCIVDLPARLVVCESTYATPHPIGSVTYHDGTRATDLWVRYHLSDQWKFSDLVDGWYVLAEERRKAREQSSTVDARTLLYEEVRAFIVEQCRTAHQSGATDPVVDIHRDWLMTPREELEQACPRDLLLAEMRHIDWDLGDREIQWGLTLQCPPGLDPSSAAYRRGGFGTHEWVLYYHLVRLLIAECWQQTQRQPELEPARENGRLEQIQQRWLETPNDDFYGLAPAELIDRERRRVPLVLSGSDVVVDDDCPLCQMMAEEMGPCFWHLDGYGMEDEFAFSPYPTRAEWNESNRELEAWCAGQEADQLPEASREPEMPARDGGIRSTVSQHIFPTADAETPLEIAFFEIGARLAELECELKRNRDGGELVQTLNRDFGNLREAVSHNPALIEPVFDRFRDDLNAAADRLPDIADQCCRVQHQILELVMRSTTAWSSRDADDTPE